MRGKSLSEWQRLLHDVSPTHKMARKLQASRTGAITYEHHAKPYCDDPVPIRFYERGRSSDKPGAYVEMFGPCRKCEKCRLFKQLQWRDRMVAELKASPRSWLVTLTFSEVHLAGILAEAYKLKYASEQERVEHAAYAHVQRYLKRIRKKCGTFRYVAVPEYGTLKGRLHYHLLIHENPERVGRVTYRSLDTSWRSFVDASLVRSSAGGGSYLSKYLTKAIARPRASKSYGSPPYGVPISQNDPSENGMTSTP